MILILKIINFFTSGSKDLTFLDVLDSFLKPFPSPIDIIFPPTELF